MPALEIAERKFISLDKPLGQKDSKFVQTILAFMGDDYDVYLPTYMWDTDASVKRLVYKFKPKVKQLFPNKDKLKSEKIIHNGEERIRVRWLNKGEKDSALTGQSPYEIIDANEADFIILTLTK